MPTDPFVILGLSSDASQSEITDAYNAKRAELKEHIFDEGEAGAEAARKLEILETAYKNAMEKAVNRAKVSGEGESELAAAREALRAHNIDLAQQELDKASYRGAEWHYMQSAVFYAKNWLNDCKKQLEIALQMDPDNPKYVEALNKLKTDMNGAHPYDKEGSQGVYGANSNPNTTATNRTYAQSSAADGCCAACETLWCMDCCCECMGGDLIRCC